MIKYDNTIAKAETFGQLYAALIAINGSRKAGFMSGSTHRHLHGAFRAKLKELERREREQKKGATA